MNRRIRLRCKRCLTTCSSPVAPESRLKDRWKTEWVFKCLVHRVPMNSICKIYEITEGALYTRIDFFYRQALLFAKTVRSRNWPG